MIKTHELSNGQGSIKYKLPNVPDLLIMFGFMKIDHAKISDATYMEENQMFMIGNLINKMGYFIVGVDVTIGEKKIVEYEDLLEEMSLLSDLVLVASDLISSLNVGTETKK